MPGRDRFWIMKKAMVFAENNDTRIKALERVAKYRKFFKKHEDTTGLRILDKVEKVLYEKFRDWK